MDKEKGILLSLEKPFATTWPNLEFILLSDTTQTETNTAWRHLYAEP